MSAAIARVRRQRLVDAMRSAGLDLLVVYGNGWQGDYLRYVTDFGLVEGHGLAVIDGDGAVAFYLESAVEAERAGIETADVGVALVADAAAAVAGALHAAGSARIGAAPLHLVPQSLPHDPRFALADATVLLDTLLMHKSPEELAAIRRSAHLADDAYAVFREASQPGRAQYEIVADVEAFLRAHGSPENFMLLGSGGPDVRGMVPPSERRLAPGDLVTTELTPETDGYYAQICRTLVVGTASREQRDAFAVYLEALEAGIAAIRPGASAHDVAKAENDVFRRHGLGEYTTSAYTRVRGHGLGLFADSKPHLLEDVNVELTPGMTVVVHPNTYHPVAGYIVLGDTVIVTETGAEIVTRTPRELFEAGR